MPNPHALETSIVDLLKAGGASQQAIQQLTPGASKLTKGNLLDLWLSQDQHSKKHLNTAPGAPISSAGQLTTQDINSILGAFENAYNSGPVGLARPQGFICGWTCCCCTPCCCCAVAVVEPVARVS
jgi:hypothetical protein